MTNRIGVKGQTIELYVRFTDTAGNPVNADSTSVTPTVAIYNPDSTLRQAATNVGVSLTDDTGLYKFSYEIPLTGDDGYWTDSWSMKVGNEDITGEFEFLVISDGTVKASTEPEFTAGDSVDWDYNKDEVNGINILLKVLKSKLKNDGTRKVPDGSGGFIDSSCSVFTDDELICFLANSLSSFNQYPHTTSFLFSDSQIYDLYIDIITQGAQLVALAAQALIEKGREFSINDNGVTFQPPQVASVLESQYNAQLADYKEKLKMIKFSLKPSPRSVGSWRVTAVSPAFRKLRHLRARQIV